jgi:hypothetical protein
MEGPGDPPGDGAGARMIEALASSKAIMNKASQKALGKDSGAPAA